jgi:Skp family chaperone for outer membrane proteins
MKNNNVTVLAAAAVILALVLTHTAQSQNAPAPAAINIAIADPAAIALKIRETQDMLAAMKDDQKTLQDQMTAKQQDLKKLQQALTYLNPNTPSYDQANQQLLSESIAYDAWVQEEQLDLNRRLKNNVKRLFDEIQDAVATVAQKKGINLVIADQRPDIPDNLDNVDIRVLQDLISRRTVLYSDQSRDISGEVQALLDQNYLNRTSPGGAPSDQNPGVQAPPPPTTPEPEPSPAPPAPGQ